MNSPAHFRFLLDSVQSQARSTPSVLHEENEHFWEDIVDSFESRHEKPNYWIFCTRWLREDLLRVMHSGSPRALQALLSVLRPDDVPAPSHSGEPSDQMNRRLIAMLLPLLMTELAVRVRNEATDRLGPYSPESTIYQSEDHRD